MSAVFVMGGSISGGGGVNDDTTRAWPALLPYPTTVHYKNAIEPSYFLHCPERFAATRSRYEAVVLDLCPNLWSADAPRSLASLVHVAMKLSNATRVGLVAWPRRGNAPDVTRLQEVARSTGAYAIRPPVNGSLYADSTHPNRRGHALIAQHVQRFVQSPSLGRVESRGLAASSSDEEACFVDARHLPVVRHDGWRLIDGGRANRSKFGWAPLRNSTRGAELELSLEMPAHRCGAIVTLAYLRTPEDGELRIRCACQCRPIRGYHQRSTFPFPHIRTRVREALRVTGTTAFTMLANGSSTCHVMLSGQQTRVDGIYVRAASDSDVANANRSSHELDGRFAAHARRRC